MTKLSQTVKTSGLARNKILAILGVLGVIVFSALIFGIFNSSENKPADINLQTDKYQETGSSTDSVLKKILEEKPNTSEVTKTLPMNNPVNSLQMVPPIITKSGDTVETDDEKAKSQYEKKRLDKKYTSFGAKSLMFSKIPVRDSSSPLVNNRRYDSGVIAEENEQKSVNEFIGESRFDLNNTSKVQVAHQKFIEDNKTVSNDYLSSTLQDVRSPYEVKAGSVIPATMINGLNSDLPGQIVAQVRENVYDSVKRKYLLIPQGAKLIGLYDSNISYGQKRILVAWNRLIYQDGSSINLKAMPGTDLEGYAGFYDEVDNKYWRIFGTSFIMGVITAGMQYSQNNTNANTQVGGLGINTDTDPTVGQTLSGSLGQQLGQTGLSLTQKNLNVQPTLIVKPNYPFNIMLTADMVLRPYKGVGK